MAVKVIEKSGKGKACEESTETPRRYPNPELNTILDEYKSIDKFDYYTWKRILNQFYYGLPKYKLEDITDIEFLTKCRDYLAREVRKVTGAKYFDLSDFEKHEYNEFVKWLNTIRSYISTAKDKNKGILEIKQDIIRDIWDVVDKYSDRGSGIIDDEGYDVIKSLRAKYKDHRQMFNRIFHKIMDEERWYD